MNEIETIFFYEIMFSVSCFELKFYCLLKTVIYNIIEQHENKEMALTYDKNTYQTKAARRRCHVAGLRNAFLMVQLKIIMCPPKENCKCHH